MWGEGGVGAISGVLSRCPGARAEGRGNTLNRYRYTHTYMCTVYTYVHV